MKRLSIIFLLLAALVSVSAAADKDALVDAVSRIVSVLDRYSLSFDPLAAQDAAITALVEEADPEGRMMTVEEATAFEEARQGVVYDVGLQVVSAKKKIIVTAVTEESPAAMTDIEVGDVLEEVDKGDVSELKATEIAELLRGAAEETVALKLRGTNDAVREIEVARGPVKMEAIQMAEELPSGIYYLRLNGVYERSGKDVISTLRGWVGDDDTGVILDLRGAGGVDVESAGDIASLFAEPNSLLYAYRDAQDQDLSVRKARPGVAFDMPAMVLIDGRTTGAAELLAAALSGSGRGVMLLGNPSRGDPMVRELIDLSDERKLYIVTRRLVTADGKVYNGKEGIQPDLLARQTHVVEYEPELTMFDKKDMSEEEKADRELRNRVRGDPVLQRAVDMLLGLKALDIGGNGI